MSAAHGPTGTPWTGPPPLIREHLEQEGLREAVAKDIADAGGADWTTLPEEERGSLLADADTILTTIEEWGT